MIWLILLGLSYLIGISTFVILAYNGHIDNDSIDPIGYFCFFVILAPLGLIASIIGLVMAALPHFLVQKLSKNKKPRPKHSLALQESQKYTN